MHPAQQKAILALLGAAEAQIQAVKSMLFIDDTPYQGAGSVPPAPRSAEFEKSYLHEREEKELDDQVEAARQHSAEEVKQLQEFWAQERAILNDELVL
jgi:hypothetical protein